MWFTNHFSGVLKVWKGEDSLAVNGSLTHPSSLTSVLARLRPSAKSVYGSNGSCIFLLRREVVLLYLTGS